jgi:hypothetical protein
MNVGGSPIFRRRLLKIRARDDKLPVLGPMFYLSAPRILGAQCRNPYRSDWEKTVRIFWNAVPMVAQKWRPCISSPKPRMSKTKNLSLSRLISRGVAPSSPQNEKLIHAKEE